VDSAQITRLHDDLQGVVRGELLFDDLSRVLYGSDASLFEVRPAAVVVPRDEEDLCALVRYAGENQIPLIPRGAGSGLAGEALGSGLVVDLSIHFRAIVRVGETTVEVEPGVTLARLNAKLAEVGRRFTPDPDHGECTVGGMLATNASGPRAARLGTTREHVEALRVVLDSGDAVDVGRLSRWPTGDALPARLADIVLSTVTLLGQNAALLRASAPLVPLDRVGYALHGILGDSELDLPRLLVGSEGTLGLFTRATLRTEPIPEGRAVVLIGFARIDAALRAARLVLSFRPTACELLDRRLLRLARGEPTLTEVVPEGAEAVLLVEFEADSQEGATAAAREVASLLVQRERTGLFSRVAESSGDAARLWQLRLPALPELHALRRAAQPVPLVEDMAVPPDRLPDFLPRVQDVLRRHDTTASFLIRPMTGQVIMRPFLDLQAPLDSARLWALADELYTLALAAGGTVSAAHGTGLARMPWVGRQLGRLAPVHRDIKSIFDPRYLFNPGKVIAGPTQAVTWPLRARDSAPQTTHQLAWTTTTPAREALACNGCGTCRTTSPAERMCPIFRAEPSEAATPRAKANLLRYLLQPDTDPALLSSDQVRAVADLCVNCKMCARECPSRVQIPRMMLEAKAANVARYGLDRGDWAFARAESFAWLGSTIAPVANAMLANPVARWLLERVFAVSRKRRMPRFAARSFLRLARKRGWTLRPRSARPRVAYFVDVFANYNDPLIAEAIVAVLHHNGIEVYVPPDQLGCGMAPLAYGDVDTARDIVQHNVRVFADLAREGFPILCSEPTAALMLRHDALDLLDDSDAALVAAQVVESTAYLWDLHQQGQLKTDFRPLPITIGHHVPCHLKALGRPPAGPALLGLIPGVRVGTIDVSCSGMAGTFGFKSDNYDVSMKAGEPMLRELSGSAYLFGSTECSACRLQMEDGTGKRTLHPVQYLALALGLVPGLLERLREPVGRRVLQ
jgi:FAD/FMN-containing dehydrogenase/Fe-S oxidoreductase